MLGLMWGSGVQRPAIVRFARKHAASGGWRARFGTELFDEARRLGSLRKALRKTPMTWTWTRVGGQVRQELTYLAFLAACEAAGLPVLLCLDPMEPGDLTGTGYHQRPLPATISFPDFRVGDLEAFVEELLALLRSEFPALRLSGLQWGNEVEYLPFTTGWEPAYERYWRSLVALGEILPAFYPGVPLINGGQSGAKRTEISLGGGSAQTRDGLTWFCGKRAGRRWGDRRAPLALAFHAVPLFRGERPHRLEIEALERDIRAWGRRLRRRFGRPVFLTELAGYHEFDRLGRAAAEAGVEGIWGIADHWLQPRWGVGQGGKTDTRALGCWGQPGWPNRETRESFKRLARAI